MARGRRGSAGFRSCGSSSTPHELVVAPCGAKEAMTPGHALIRRRSACSALSTFFHRGDGGW